MVRDSCYHSCAVKTFSSPRVGITLNSNYNYLLLSSLLAANMLRAHQHVMGSLVAAHPRQNSVPGLPFSFMPGETTLLV